MRIKIQHAALYAALLLLPFNALPLDASPIQAVQPEQGLTKEQFIQLVHDALPSLDIALKQDKFTAIKLLLAWSAKTSNWDYCPTQYNVHFMQPWDMYNLMWSKSCGASCGAFSVFFERLLKLFDIDAFTVNYGTLAGSMTHVTTVVPIKDNNKYQFYIFDATVNGYYVDPASDKPIDLEAILSAKRQYHLKEESFTRLRVFDDGRKQQVLYSSQTLKDIWASSLKKQGIDATGEIFIPLLKRGVFSVGEANDMAAREAFLGLLDRYGIPFGSGSN